MILFNKGGYRAKRLLGVWELANGLKKCGVHKGFMVLEVLAESLLLGILLLGILHAYQETLYSWRRVQGLQRAVLTAERGLAGEGSWSLPEGFTVEQGAGKYGEIRVLRDGKVVYNLFGAQGGAGGFRGED